VNIGMGKFLRNGLTAESIESALRRIVAAVTAGFAREHREDGTHTDVTADTIDVAGTAAIGDDATVTGDLTVANETIVLSETTSGGTVTGANGPGIDFDGTGVSGGRWAVIASDDNLAESLGFYDTANAVEAIKLYRISADTYALCPSEDGVATVTLGVGGFGSDPVFDEVRAFRHFEGAGSVAMGEWNAVAFNAANFTASAGTWTVASGDQIVFKYTLLGKTMTVNFRIDTSSVSATPAQLRIAIPGGFTAASDAYNGGLIYQDAGGGFFGGGSIFVVSGGTTIGLQEVFGTSSWAVATDTTYVAGQITFEVQ
jgi:hypothetical protein